MCVDGRGTDVELHLAMFGHMVKLFDHNVWQSFIMEMASTINEMMDQQYKPDRPHTRTHHTTIKWRWRRGFQWQIKLRSITN